MGGFFNPVITDNYGVDQPQAPKRPGLFRSLLGTVMPGMAPPTPGATPPITKTATERPHMEDDPQTRQAPPSMQPDPYAPLSARVQQMQGEYDKLNAPPPQTPFEQGHPKLASLVHTFSRMLPVAGAGLNAAGLAPDDFNKSQAQLDWEQAQKDAQKKTLLQAIMQGQGDISREQLADARLAAQQKMEQDRFGQQDKIEQQRIAQEETNRAAGEQHLIDTIRAQGDRQQAGFNQQAAQQQRQFGQQTAQQQRQFAEQEKLEAMRQAASQGKTDTAAKEKVLTYWQPTLDSAERLNVMTKNYKDAVENHDQQAMLSLLANHLGMTMGLQKGARLNQAIINEAQKARPWLQGMQAKFDKDGYLTGVVLTPQQMQQMVALGAERYREDVHKSRAQGAYVGVTDEPGRQISRETAKYYLDEAGGDVNKARANAKADGWKF